MSKQEEVIFDLYRQEACRRSSEREKSFADADQELLQFNKEKYNEEVKKLKDMAIARYQSVRN